MNVPSEIIKILPNLSMGYPLSTGFFIEISKVEFTFENIR